MKTPRAEVMLLWEGQRPGCNRKHVQNGGAVLPAAVTPRAGEKGHGAALVASKRIS